MKIVLTGGGTGGHIYPALAIADKFKEKDPAAEFLYIGDKNCMESTIVPRAGYEFRDVPAEEVDRKNVFKLIKTGYKNIKGISAAKKIMKRFYPDIVIGTGGFVSFPVMCAGHSIGAKCYIHEENAFPGLTNKLLEKRMNKISLGFEAAKERFRCKDKLVVTGNPVRSGFKGISGRKAREVLGIKEDDFVLLAFGGSLGAEQINSVMYDVMKKLNGMNGITLIFGTGEIYYDELMKRVKQESVETKGNIIIKPYLDDMVSCLGASDLVLSRSGALTVAESGVAGRPSILVPSPNVTGNHQYYNAKAIEEGGGAILIPESELTPSRVIEEVFRLRDDRSVVAKMAERATAMAPSDATDRIYEMIMSDIKEH